MECSNIMYGGVTTTSSGHISVRLHQYLLRLGFYLHTPTLLPKPYDLLLPQAHGSRGVWTPILCQFQVKDRTHENVLCHTGVEEVDVIPNCLQPHFYQCLSNDRVLPFSILVLMYLSRNPQCHPMMQSPQRL